MSTVAAARAEQALRVKGLTVNFPGVKALDAVNFDVRPGEVHALVGENGAGKSTLAKVLAGEQTAFRGQLLLDGIEQAYGSPREALRAGVAMIPQELQFVSSLTAADNIFLGHERGGGVWIDGDLQCSEARERLATLGAERVPPTARMGRLDAGSQQLVAIARALTMRASYLILDEPTAALGDDDSRRLTALVSRLADQGAGVIWISHRLDEVIRVSDRISVLRDGAGIATVKSADIDENGLVRLMVGREIATAELPEVADDADELMVVDRLTLEDPRRPGHHRFRDVSFTVRQGEVVGLAGLVGARRTDFLRALVGADPVEGLEGSVTLEDGPYEPSTPAAAHERGLFLVPEDRKADGTLPRLSVSTNLTVSALDRVASRGWISPAAEREQVRELMSTADVRAATPEVPIATLSGGNQQKALLARCLFAAPRVLLLDEPTRGIDLAAKAEIYQAIHDLVAAGYGVVLCSSEMSEILGQCHRVVVFRDGRIVDEVDTAEATEERIVAAAGGSSGKGPSDDGAGGEGGGEGPPPAGAPGTSWRRILEHYSGVLGLGLVLALAVVFSPVRDGFPIFLGLGNLTDILRQVAERGILAVGMTAVIITGGIDLSVGSVLAFSATLAALLWMSGFGLLTTILLVLACCAAWGALNGVIVSRWKLPAFIVTLATMSAARGTARFTSGGTAIPLGFGEGGAPESVLALATPVLPYVPAPALIFVLTVAAMHVMLTRTTMGRYLYAIGDNTAAARLAGVRVAWHTTSVYVVSAVLAGVAGIVHCAQLQQGNPNDGVAYELDAIAAVVVGGTALSGGTGSVGGTLIGVLLIGIINNSLGLNNVDANLQLILKGLIILAAVWTQRRRSS